MLAFCIAVTHFVDDLTSLIVREEESRCRAVDEETHDEEAGLMSEGAVTQCQILFKQLAVNTLQSARLADIPCRTPFTEEEFTPCAVLREPVLRSLCMNSDVDCFPIGYTGK